MSTSTPDRRAGGKRRLLIVDDHPIVRRGLADLLALEPDLEVCGEADSVAAGLSEVEACRPDLVVVDMSLNESHGIELISQIKARFAHVKTLVWSMFDEEIFAERALRAGAMAYVSKKEPIDNILHAVRQVLQGDMYLSPRMTNRLLRRVGGGIPLEKDPVSSLSDRELQVFEMIGQGLNAKQIARQLEISPKTVDNHREKIKTKLNLGNAADVIRRAAQWMLENG